MAGSCKVVVSSHVGDIQHYLEIAPSWFYDGALIHNNGDFNQWLRANPSQEERGKIMSYLSLEQNIGRLNKIYESFITA